MFTASSAVQRRLWPIHTINTRKIAQKAKDGKKVYKITLYRLLGRHGWGSGAIRMHRPPSTM